MPLPSEARRERNDVHMWRWAKALNLTVVHSNLLWGNTEPEAADFVVEVKHRRTGIGASILGAVTLHKTCPAGSCRVMRELHLILSTRGAGSTCVGGPV